MNQETKATVIPSNLPDGSGWIHAYQGNLRPLFDDHRDQFIQWLTSSSHNFFEAVQKAHELFLSSVPFIEIDNFVRSQMGIPAEPIQVPETSEWISFYSGSLYLNFYSSLMALRNWIHDHPEAQQKEVQEFARSIFSPISHEAVDDLSQQVISTQNQATTPITSV